MKILIAPDKFKGSLGAREVAENIARALRDALRDAKIDIVPMADGGEGTADVICRALGGSWLECKAHDPLGRKIECRCAYIDPPSPRLRRDKLAVIEMSEAAGMRRLSASELDPLQVSTFGVGEMILDAAARGADRIIIGLGGSATNDGGFGTARALGFRFFGEDLKEIARVGDLVALRRISPSPQSSPSGRGGREAPGEGLQRLPQIIVAADVRNPLLGENGATRVFGPQKGATPEKIEILERALARLADIVAEQFGFDYREGPGAGAAGGLGFGLMSFCGAKIRPGFEVVAEAVELRSKMQDVDVVITGEGSLDRQTLEGKTPAGVARLARKLGKRIFAIVGRASEDREVRQTFDGVYELARPGMSMEEQVGCAAELLRENARELGEMLRETANAQRPMFNGRKGKKKRATARAKGCERGSR